MMHLIRQRYRRGSAVIEFTAAMFMFVLVLIFILQGGALMFTAVTAANAAREGARAAVTLPPGDPYSAVQRVARQFPSEVNVGGGGDSVTVNVRLRAPVLFDAVADWDWWVSATSTMRRER